jgi:hypothetical protein
MKSCQSRQKVLRLSFLKQKVQQDLFGSREVPLGHSLLLVLNFLILILNFFKGVRNSLPLHTQIYLIKISFPNGWR